MRPATGDDFTLVMTAVSTAAMTVLLEHFSRILEPEAHAVLDQAGWPGAGRLTVPDNVTLLPLPPYSANLNPVKRLWLFLCERHLLHRLLDDYDAIVNACCRTWNALVRDQIQSLTNFPWIQKVSS